MFFRPMSFGEVIDGIFRSLKRTFWPLWWFLFLFNLPLELFLIFWESVAQNTAIFDGLLLLFFVIYLFFLFPLFQNTCTTVVTRQIKQNEKKLTLGFLFANALKQFDRLFLANAALLLLLLLLTVVCMLPMVVPIYLFYEPMDLLSNDEQLISVIAIVIMVGCMLWLFPASYLGIRLSLALPVITEEKLSVKEAFLRSWSLTKRSYFLLFGKWVMLCFLLVPIIFLGIYLTDVLQEMQLLLDFLLLLIDPVFIALPHLLLSFIYLNQRAKKEGYDLELLLAERGGNPLSQKLNRLENN